MKTSYNKHYKILIQNLKRRAGEMVQAVKNTCYSFSGPEFGSQQLSWVAYNLPIIPALGDPMSFLASRHWHICGWLASRQAGRQAHMHTSTQAF